MLIFFSREFFQQVVSGLARLTNATCKSAGMGFIDDYHLGALVDEVVTMSSRFNVVN